MNAAGVVVEAERGRYAGFVKLIGQCVLLLCLGLLCAASPADDAAAKLIGRQMPEWQLEHWLNSPPLKLAELKGKVVLVRWWTAPPCPYCKASAPALNEFYSKYNDQGLEVIGIYHHKSDAPLRVEDVKKYAAHYGFKFPVAVDPDWRTLHKWWLDRADQQWTSVSFLLDKEGKVQWIHPGGQYVKGDRAYKELDAKIRELLAQ